VSSLDLQYLYAGVAAILCIVVLFVVTLLREWVDERRVRASPEIEVSSILRPDGLTEVYVITRRSLQPNDLPKRVVVKKVYRRGRLICEEIVTEIDRVVVGSGSVVLIGKPRS